MEWFEEDMVSRKVPMLIPLRQQHEHRITMGRVVMHGSIAMMTKRAKKEDDDEGTEGGMQKERRFTLMGLFRSCLAPCASVDGG